MKEHRQKSINSIPFQMIGKDRYLVKVADVYPDNCTETEEMVINKETLDALLRFKDEELRAQDKDKEHRAHKVYVYDDNFISELGYYVKSATGDVEAELFIEQVLSGYDSVEVKCAKYRFLHDLSMREIADILDIPLVSVHRIIETVKPALCKALKEAG